MDTAGFFSRVLPPDGAHFTITWPGPDKKRGWPSRSFPINKGFEAATGLIGWTVKNKIDIYHAVASFAIADPRSDKRGEGYIVAPRTQGNVQFVRSLFIDADVAREGDGKDPARVFPDRRAALRWLLTFCADTGMPKPTIIVNSGHGFHWYWCLEQALKPVDWLPLARALQSAAVSHQFVGDIQIVTDSARILRPPGSVNMKSGEPVRVTVERAADRDVSVADVTQALTPWLQLEAATGTHSRRPATVTTLGPRPPHAQAAPDTAMNDAAMAGVERRAWKFATIAQKCEQVKQSLATGGEGDSYNLWTAHHTLAAHCVDGAAHIHPFSERDPRYDHEANEVKFAQTQDEIVRKGLGAPRCTTYQTLRTGVCDKCAWFGKLNSPISLGTDDGDLPLRYRRQQIGPEVYIQWRNAEGDWLDVIQGDAYAPRLDHLLAGGYMLSFTHELGGVRSPVSCRGAEMGHGLTVLGIVEKQGISADRHSAGRVGDFVVAWINQLRTARVERTTTLRPFGWNYAQSGERIGLAIAGTLYRKDGIEEQIAGGDPNIRVMYTPMGTLDAWKRAAALFEDKRPDLQTFLACGFASPLVGLCGDVRGMSILFWSQESGVGKTSVIKLAISLFGDYTAMQSMTDTPNAVMKSLSEPRLLARFWDELRVRKNSHEQWVELIYQIPQGKERARLQTDATLREVGEWDALLVFAANRPMSDILLHHTAGTDSGLYRLLELPLYKEKHPYHSRAGGLIKLTETNYGHAGRIYAKYLAMHADEVEHQVRANAEKIGVALGARQEERFYITAIATIITGAQLAARLELFKFDLPGIYDYLKRGFFAARQKVENRTMLGPQGGYDMEQLIGEYYAESAEVRLRTDELTRPGVRKVNVLSEPRSQLVRLQYAELPKPIIRAARYHLLTWLNHHSLPGMQILEQLQRDCGAVEHRQVIGGGTKYAGLKTAVVDIPLSPGMLEAIEDEEEEKAAQPAPRPSTAKAKGKAKGNEAQL